MTTYRKIPIVLQSQNNIVDAVSVETVNGTKQLLTDIEFSLFEGDDTVTPKSFQGIYQQIASYQSGSNIIDMAGAPLNSIDPIARAAEQVFGYGSFGVLTDLYLPPAIQTDLNISLDPAFRVALDNTPNSISLGTTVRAIQTTYGAIATRNDVFIRDERMKKPFEVRGGVHAAVVRAHRGRRQHLGADQVVIQHQAGALQRLDGLHRQQLGVAGTCAYQPHLSVWKIGHSAASFVSSRTVSISRAMAGRHEPQFVPAQVALPTASTEQAPPSTASRMPFAPTP